MAEPKDDPNNPWSYSGWSLTGQADYVRANGLPRAEARARDAGTRIGGPRPKPPKGEQKPKVVERYILSKRLASGADGDHPVESVFGRTGAVVAEADDYSIDQIAGAGALAELDTVDTDQIEDDAVTNAKAANMAQDTIKGRATAGTGDPEDLTATQVRAILNVEDGANNYVHPNHSGDVTSVGDGATTIANNAVSNAKLRDSGALSVIGRSAGTDGDPADIVADTDNRLLRRVGTDLAFGQATTGCYGAATVTNDKLANMSQSTIKGRSSGSGTGAPEDLTASQVRTIINVEDGANNYVHPNHSGDVTSVGDGATTIANDVVSFAKMQNIASDRLIGRDTALTGDPEEITVGGGIEFTGSAGIQRSALTGDVTASAGSGSTTIANDAVTNAKAANMAANTIKGRITGSTGDPEDLTAANVRTIINVADGANNYTHPNHTGDVTSVGDGATTIANDAVTNAKLRDSGALSVIGRSAASDGDPADIVADTDNRLLRRSGTTLAFGQATTGCYGDNTVTNAKLANMAANTIKGRITASTGVPEDLTAANVRTIINVADGANNYTHPNHTGDVTSVGDGATTIAANAVTDAKFRQSAACSVVGRNANSIGDVADIPADLNTILARGPTGGVLFRDVAYIQALINVEDGANNYTHPNHTGDVTSIGDGATAIANNAVTNSHLRDSGALSVIGRGSSTSGDPADIVADTDNRLLRRSGTTLAFGQATTGCYGDTSVTSAKLATDSVLTNKVADSQITYVKMQDVSAAARILGRASGAGSGVVTELTGSQCRTILSIASPIVTRYTSGSGTHSPDSLTTGMMVDMVGGGGGGGGSGTGAGATNGGTGGDSTFGSITAAGGVGGLSTPNGSTGGSGPSASADGNLLRAAGSDGSSGTVGLGGSGGPSSLGGRGRGGLGGNAGRAAGTNTGSGGGGGGDTGTDVGGGGGSGAVFKRHIFVDDTNNKSYEVGSTGSAGGAGTGGQAGGAGAAGQISVLELRY